MKNKNNNNNSDRGFRRKHVSKQHINRNRNFITRPKNVGPKFNKCKLFSLQHQTLSLLRRADKYQIKKQSKSLDDLSCLMKHTVINDNEKHLSSHLKGFTNKKQKEINKSCSNSSTFEFQKNGSSGSSVLDTATDNEIKISSAIILKPDIDLSVKHSIKKNIQPHISKKKKKKLEKAVQGLEDTSNKQLISDDVSFAFNNSEVPECVENEDDNCGIGNTNNIKKIKLLKSKQPKKRLKKSASHSFSDLEGSMDFSFDHDEKLSLHEEDNDAPPDGSLNNKDGCPLFNTNANIDFYQFSKNRVLLTVLHPCSLCFIGILEIEVLMGSINILGCNLNASSGKNTVFSPKGSCHLCITTKESESIGDVSNVLSRYNIPKNKLDNLREKFSKNAVMLILSKDESDISSIIWPNLVQKYSGHVLLPQINLNKHVNAIEDALQTTFQLPSESTTKLYREMHDWDSVFNYIKSGINKTVICGGKGVGKSTLLRYLVNRSLSVWKKVLVLDFDPGQSEFMVPGCISAFLVSSPLLGPNFTHILDPIRCAFFGLVEAQQALKYYFDCVQNVIDYCNANDELRGIPWFFNTMGYSKGFGVHMTSSVIKKISPTVLVQIEGKHQSRNFPSRLTPEYVVGNILDLSRHPTDKNVLNYRVFFTESAVINEQVTKKNKKMYADIWGISSPSLRNIMILAYFGQMLNSRVKYIFEAEPFVVNIANINLQVLNENLSTDEVLDAMNGNLVGLCDKNIYTNEINTCFGFGIVRAINRETGELFLLTPLKEDKLRLINSLIKGSVPLPSKLLSYPPESVSGHVPYINVSSNILSCEIKKTFKNVMNDK